MPDANDLNLEEWEAVVALIRDKIETDKFPLSDRIRTLRSALQARSEVGASTKGATAVATTNRPDGGPPKDAAMTSHPRRDE